jgi:D-threo-aldose 1-dehydrogenase
MAAFASDRRVGRTDVLISKLGLGGAPLGGWQAEPDPDAQAVATVHYALDQGIRFLDTAPYYGAGRSERLYGEALRDVPRDSFVLATKAGRRVEAGAEGRSRIVRDDTRDGVLRSIDESLERLRLDRIDIAHIHDPDEHYREALDVVFPTLAQLRGEGVIRAIGAGMNQWEMLLDFARNADFDCFLLAGRYTLLEQKAVHEFLPYCQAHGIGVFLGGIFNSGILAVGARPGATYNYDAAPPEVVARVQRIEAVCERHGVPLRVAATQFPLAHPAVTSMLVGARSPEEVQAAIDALDTPIPPALWVELREEGLLEDGAPVPGEETHET